MAEWIPMFAMPNIKIQDPVEINGIAIASIFDGRLKALADKYPKFKLFIGLFTQEFGTKVSPSFIMVRDDAPVSYRRVDALASFRDALAISVVSHTWAKAFKFGRGGMYGPQYSNSFSFYPWMLDKTYDAVSTRSMALFGYENDIAKMRPQTTPGISVTWLTPQMIDQALLAALLKRWSRRYSGRSPSWTDRALFRSLNMASAAAMVPAHAEITNPDIGRHTALWVSAFEILAHPKTSNSGYKQVYSLLEKATYGSSHHKRPVHQAYFGRTAHSPRILPCWIYGELNHARNDFLHGNPVGPARLTTKRSKKGLFFYASPLYRMALTAFLDLRWKRKAPSPKKLVEYLKYNDEKFEFEAYQRQVEAGLYSIKFTEKEAEDIRNGRLKPTIVRWP